MSPQDACRTAVALAAALTLGCASFTLGCSSGGGGSRPDAPEDDAQSDADADSSDGGADAELPDGQGPDAPGPDAGPDAIGKDTGAPDADAEVDAGTPISALAGRVFVTEIMRNPLAVADSQGEWIELHNASDAPVSLEGITLRDDGTDAVVLPPVVVAAGGYVVLAASALPGTNGGIPEVDAVYDPTDFILGNAQDAVVLEAEDGIVHAVRYGTAAEGWPDIPGRSLSLHPAALTALESAEPSSWCSGKVPYGLGDYGSPGQENPPCEATGAEDCANGADDDGDGDTDCDDAECAGEPACAPYEAGALVISEVMANPSVLPDTQGEWIEIYNPGEAPIDLRGFELADSIGQVHVIAAAEPIEVEAGGYAVLANAGGALGLEASPGYVWGDGYALGNSSDDVVLRFGGVVVDAVAWGAGAAFEVVEGASASLDVDSLTAEQNDLAQSWCRGRAPYGTGDLGSPGAANPDCGAAECGNEVVETGEDCDDGNDQSGDGCEPDCTFPPPGCGNGAIEPGEDCDDGGQVGGDGCSATCQEELPLPLGTLVISELMINPGVVSDAGGEWLELYNPTANPVDLAGFVLSDPTGEKHVIQPSTPVIVLPGDFVVLGRVADVGANGGIPLDYVYGADITLSNTTDAVVLSFAGEVVDQVAYAVPTWTIPQGASLELDPKFLDYEENDSPAVWCAATQKPAVTAEPCSPGLANAPCEGLPFCGDGNKDPGEQCDDNNQTAGDGCELDCTLTPTDCGDGETEPGEQCDDGNDIVGDGCEPDCTKTIKSYPPGALVISEIMANPAAAADATGEWFEVWNSTGEAIDLVGFSVRDAGGQAQLLAAPAPVLVAPQGYAVLGNGGSGQNGGVPVAIVYSQTSLGNTADTLEIIGPDGVVVDAVTYGPGAAFLPASGISAKLTPEKLSASDNDLAANWCPSLEPMLNGDKGTPGFQNLSCLLPPGCGDAQCAGADSCATCPQDCGPCNPCQPRNEPGCGGCGCESCVCELDPTCCTTAWDAECVVRCQDQCGGPSCLGTGCVATAVPSCADCECKQCVCDADPTCCSVAWDEACVSLCGVCGQDCEPPDGCTPQAAPGCADCACQPCVCAQKPSCCTESWDSSCVALCESCGGNCKSNGCAPSVLPGCKGCTCQSCVCAADPFCCAVAWDLGCVESCIGCGQDCGSDGCNLSAVGGCDGCSCTACVCAQDPTCCTSAWDAACVDACIDCGQDCPGPTCGNGKVEIGEQCDVGVNNSDEKADACRTNCELPKCGDSVKDTGEACDDGGLEPGDGCSPVCLVEVAPPKPGEVVITEIMYKPATIFDIQGEWFEVYNASPKILDLDNVVVVDQAGASFTVQGNPQFLVAPGDYAVFGNNANLATNGGVAVDYAYSALFSLDNVGTESLTLWLGGVQLDRVVFGAPGFSSPNGASLSLDPTAQSSSANDLAINWCAGAVTYGFGDKGTPGVVNPTCGKCADGECTFGEDCTSCKADCGACTDGCKPFPQKGCDGCPCQSCVCALDPSCCNLGWDAFCVTLCEGCGGCPSVCGDGETTGTEECDDGPANSDTAPDACRTDCTLARCGDFVLDSGEKCDDGNEKGGDGCSLTCQIEAINVSIGDLVITEIMNNPEGVPDSLGEWIEIYNDSNKTIDLFGFAIFDAISDFHIIDDSIVLTPGKSVVLGANADLALNGGAKVDYAYDQFSLSNASDEILLSYAGVVVDVVFYDNGATFPDIEGKSMQLDGTKLDAVANNVGSNWCPSPVKYGASNFGTPGAANVPCVAADCGNGVVEPGEECDLGAANSDTEPDTCRSDCTEPRCGDGVQDAGEECDDNNLVLGDACSPECLLPVALGCGNGVTEPGEECDDGNKDDTDLCTSTCVGVGPKFTAGALVISELMVDPLQVSDAVGEWIEVYNPGLAAIDARFLVFADAFGGIHKVKSSVLIPPGGYATFGSSTNLDVNGGANVDYAWGGDVTLSNLGTGGVAIQSPIATVDSVFWSPGWPVGPGAALSLDPGALSAQSNDAPSNWCAAKALYNSLDRGTPKAPNTPCGGVPDCGNDLVEAGEECDDGNETDGDGCSALCQDEFPAPGPDQVVFTEFMPRPLAVLDGSGEWFELTNVHSATLDLNGCTLFDASGGVHTISAGGSLLVAPGQAVVLAASPFASENGQVNPVYAYGSEISLSNSGSLVILQCNDTIVDAGGYGLWPVWPNWPGRSIQLDPSKTSGQQNDQPSFWCMSATAFASGDLGSPGSANPACPPVVQGVTGGLVITEIQPHPEAGFEGVGEWFEVYNSQATTVDLRGLILSNGSSQVHVVTAGSPLLVPSGGLAVLGRGTPPGNGGYSATYVYADIDMVAEGDSLILSTPGVMFDEVSWSTPAFPLVSGAALNLAPSFTSAAGNNAGAAWCPAETTYGPGGKGSPGAPNPPCP